MKIDAAIRAVGVGVGVGVAVGAVVDAALDVLPAVWLLVVVGDVQTRCRKACSQLAVKNNEQE